MITTISISSISTISSTISTISAFDVMGLTAAISIAAVASLIFFLAVKEVANAGGSPTSLRIARVFNVGILPLVMAFGVIIAVKITELIA